MLFFPAKLSEVNDTILSTTWPAPKMTQQSTQNVPPPKATCPANYAAVGGDSDRFYYEGAAESGTFVTADDRCPPGTRLASFESQGDYDALKTVVANNRAGMTKFPLSHLRM